MTKNVDSSINHESKICELKWCLWFPVISTRRHNFKQRNCNSWLMLNSTFLVIWYPNMQPMESAVQSCVSGCFMIQMASGLTCDLLMQSIHTNPSTLSSHTWNEAQGHKVNNNGLVVTMDEMANGLNHAILHRVGHTSKNKRTKKYWHELTISSTLFIGQSSSLPYKEQCSLGSRAGRKR